MPFRDLPELVDVFAAEGVRSGRTWGRLPLRREIFVGRDRRAALDHARHSTDVWSSTMARQGATGVSARVGTTDDDLATKFVVGTVQECVTQLERVATPRRSTRS